MATKEKMPQRNIDAKPIHRLPHLSRKRASRTAAGSSVREAKENDVKTSGSRSFMFQTWPSNTHTISNLEKKSVESWINHAGLQDRLLILRVLVPSRLTFIDANYILKQVLNDPHKMLHILS